MAKKAKSTKTWAKYPESVAINYWRNIRPVIDRIRKIYNELILPELNDLLRFSYVEVPDTSKDDSVTEKIGRLFRRFRINYYGQEYPIDGDPKTIIFRNKLENQVSKDSKTIARFHKNRFDNNAKFVIGIDPLKREPWLKGYLRDWTTQNVNLIKDLPDFAIGSMEQLVTRSVLRGDSQTFLKNQIANLLGVTETRARLIARDQSNKLYGTLTELRSQFNGWDFYEWDDSNDSRVRTLENSSGYSDHGRLDGKIFKFSEPPVTVFKGKRDGERNNPGQDIQCFPKGTMIKTKNGQKPIEEIKLGDFVHSHGGIEEVVELHKNNYKGELIGIKFLHKTIWLTPNHKLFINGRGWIRADSLKKGDKPVEFKELFSGNFLNKKTARNIEHPHPNLLSKKIVTNRIDALHRRNNLNNCIQFIKFKVGHIIDSINPIWLLELPLRRIINTKNVKPSSTKNFRFWDNPAFAIPMTYSLFCRDSHFSSLWISDPLGSSGFTSISDFDSKMNKRFLDNPTANSYFFGDHSIRPKFIDIFINKPFFKVYFEFFLNRINIAKKKTFISTLFRTKKRARIFKPRLDCFKSFIASFAINMNVLIWSSHNFLRKIINKKTAKHHYEVVGLDCQAYDDVVYNFGVNKSMSYFAENILVSNCRCVALVIMDREKISQLKKQPDGSYAIPTIKAA